MSDETTYSFLIIDTFDNKGEHIYGYDYPENKIPNTNREAAEFVLEQYNLVRKDIPYAAAGIVVLIFEDDNNSHKPIRTFLLRSTLKYYLHSIDERNPGGHG